MILVTGAAGYIGSHTVVELIAAGHAVVGLDNHANSSPRAWHRVEQIVGRKIPLVVGDVADQDLVASILRRHAVTAVIHFAALKAVGESVAEPLRYYENNIAGTLALLSVMREASVKRMVFSSSATVYGVPQSLPLTESHPVGPVNPYGQTKAMVEQILSDVCQSDAAFGAVSLRYFNPIGAHASGLIGEAPQGTPNNVFPFITQVAVGKRAELAVFGGDWDTPDGTGVRDYIHVVDLARGHVKAVDYVLNHAGAISPNLGTGRGTSVLELVRAFERASGQKVPYRIGPRRSGDIASSWADPALAQRVLGWKAEHDVDTMCVDGWRWQQANPAGYAD